MNKKERLFVLILVAVFFSIIIVVAIYSTKSSINMKNSQIEGRIDSINYTRQGYPYIYVKGKFYDLTNYNNDKITIQVGDSIVKRQGSRTIYIIREENNKTAKYAFD